ncbi:MAG: LLM class F420-dependent oxidoreductase [Solirubrobacterales bacterium]|nr:LLM class F420-dependent oxidoreductase [Solirubrobacterales bacterium]MBV9797706.1 LLM class F420-dependent oxidoreductase [Solirubrobacterales bacterium]
MARDLRLGLSLGYWAGGPPPGAAESVLEAERLGFDSVWTAEAYGSDAITPLAWWGAATHEIKLGTAIVQISARTPAATAMAAMTLDHLSSGRLILGLGVSGPQVVEGWYGQPFAKPLARMREYIGIVREIWARNGPVTNPGPHYPLPIKDGTGLGKPLKSSIRPLRADIPIYLAAEGPKNIALAGELCDGWLALFYSPHHDGLYRDALNEGLARPAARRTPQEFEVAATVPLIVTDDIEQAADALRPGYALYFGGMGAKSANFHANVPIRMGYEAEVAKIQELYLSGDKEEAAAAVPTKLIEQLTLIGSKDKIRHDLEAWRDSIVTTLLVGGDPATLRTAADLVLG